MLNQYVHEGQAIGEYYEDESLFCFFGNRHVDFETLQLLFKDYQFIKLQQVHGDQMVSQPGNANARADAHHTEAKRVALTIITADCIPIFYSTKNIIMALHCGWRGIENNLIAKSKGQISEGLIKGFVGPHILKNRFEVGLDVAKQLECVAQNYSIKDTILAHAQPEKKYVDLKKIALAQLGLDDVICSKINTYDNLDWHSFRRDSSQAGRNVSFVTFK